MTTQAKTFTPKPDFLVTLTSNKGDFRSNNKVAVGFTMALAALEKGHTVQLMLLSESVFLGRKNYADDIDVGEPFKRVKEMFDTFMAEGGELLVCKSCMGQNGVKPEELREGAIVITASDVVDLIMNSRRSLQLN